MGSMIAVGITERALGLRTGPRGVEPSESADALTASTGNVRIVHAALQR